MQSDRLSVAVTRRLPEVVEKRMDELFNVEFRTNDAPMSKSELIEMVKRCLLYTLTLPTRKLVLLAGGGGA